MNHNDHIDCQEDGMFVTTQRRVSDPEMGWNAEVCECAVCGREAYEWADDMGEIVQVDYMDDFGGVVDSVPLY